MPINLSKSTVNGLGVQKTGQRMPWANIVTAVSFVLKPICFVYIFSGGRQAEGRIQVASASTMPVTCIFSSQHRNEFILN